MILLFHPFESPSGNDFHKRHWSEYARHKAFCRTWAIFTHRSRGYKKIMARCAVDFVTYRRRLLDDDNMIIGLKGLRDSLVEAGFLYDDSPKWATFTYVQKKRDASPYGKVGTEISIALLQDVV